MLEHIFEGFEDWEWPIFGAVTQIDAGAPLEVDKKVKTCPSFVMGKMAKKIKGSRHISHCPLCSAVGNI